MLALGLALGAASLVLYRQRGYSTGMLVLWLAALAVLSAYFWSRNRSRPRIDKLDLLAPAGLALVFSPLYLIALYRWPVQVSSDEVAIIGVARDYSHPVGVDPFGVSEYLSRPTLLFIFWGKLGELVGGFDLYHMRLLHALVGLLTIAASYALLRQLLPRGWAVLAVCVFAASHAFVMISRLAMRENTAVLVEVVGLALLLWGLRNDHLLATFWGGLVAGFGYYVYFPARVTLPVWIAFLFVLALVMHRSFPVRRLLTVGAVAVAGFVLVATPIAIAETKIPPLPGPSDAEPQKETLMIYADAREKQRTWVSADTVAEGWKKNIRWGLGTFNNTVTDEGFIYTNTGHGFVDPLTGILLWLGVGLILVRLFRREGDEGMLLAVVGFLILWLSFAFLVNKAPNYTRLLVTLPFVAYFVTEAIRMLAGRWRSVPRAPAVIVGTGLAALVVWNLAIGWDYIQTGRRDGDTIGSTGRYVHSLRHVRGQRFFLAGTGDQYYTFGGSNAAQSRLQLFAENPGQVPFPIDSAALATFSEPPPFAIFMRRDIWAPAAAQLANRYPRGRVRNVTPDGTHVVFDVPS